MYKNKRTSLLIICGIFVALALHAKPRTKAEMQAIAKQSLTQRMGNKRLAKGADKIIELKRETNVTIFGYKEGGFAVVSSDDLLPAVLGSSSATYSEGRNPGFQWWLKAVNAIAQEIIASGKAYAPIAPDTKKFPASVANMVAAEWGQETPFNNYCPIDGDGRAMTGCVATAMAQILYTYKYPAKGYGERTIYFPYHNPKGTPVTAKFGDTTYQWDKMKKRYTFNALSGITDYTEEEADAVATIMMHCGVASDMQYSAQGSGAYTNEAAYGLRTYFGIKTARHLDRKYYDNRDSVWMEEIFHELSSGRPVLYGAVDKSMGGHAFVLSGYQEDGKVYVNWGWNGDENGYYDVSILKTKAYQFDIAQDMIVGINPKAAVKLDNPSLTDAIADEVTVTEPGTLAQKLPADKRDRVYSLKINGPLNGADFKLLRYMVGRDVMQPTRGSLTHLDLSDASIVSGGGQYIDASDAGFTYETVDDEFPARIFYNCRILNKIVLPKSMKRMGIGALALCTALDEAEVTNADDKEYEFEDGTFYSKDGKKLISVLPSKVTTLRIREGVEQVMKDAAAGCIRMSGLVIPSTLKRIENYGFYGCYSMTSIRSYAEIPPMLVGQYAMQDVGTTYCKLYVPIRSRQNYLNASFWSDFKGVSEGEAYNNIIEFGTFIKARNTIKEYGDENPKLGYQIEGDFPNGTPVITCDATPASKVGTYAVKVERGTIKSEIFKSENGELIVRPALLKVTVKPASRNVGEENPTFELVYEGFKNGEDESVLTEKPIVTTTATKDSPEGSYALVVSGGSAENYEFEFTNGLMYIFKNATGIDEVQSDDSKTYTIYTIDGQLVRKNATNLVGLKKGVYLINNRKVIIK